MTQLGGIGGLAWKTLPLSLAALPTYSGPTLAIMSTGALGWYDAGSAADLLDGSGQPIAQSGTVISMRNRYGAGLGSIAPYDNGGVVNGGVSTGWKQVPRLVGTEAGLRNSMNAGVCEYDPPPALDSAVNLPVVTLGSGVARTLYMVWSRVNRQQTGQYGAGPTSNVIELGSTVLVQSGNAGDGTDHLTLFPGTASATDLGVVPPRYTQSITLVMTAAGRADVWLGDGRVAQNIVVPLASSVTGTLTLARGLDFHEAWIADHAITAGEIATLLTNSTSCSKRWARGTRIVPLLPRIGQSNSARMNNAGGFALLAEAARWAMGALAVEITAGDDRSPKSPGTVAGGTPLIQRPGETNTTYINRNGGTSDPNTWPYADYGTSFLAYFTGLPARDKARLAGLIWPYAENDADHGYGDKANYAVSRGRIIADMRAACGIPTLPVWSFNTWPFGSRTELGVGSDDGAQALREVFDAAIASPTGYETRILHNLADCDYGVYNGDDTSHMSDPSYRRLGVRAGLVLGGLLGRDASAAPVGGLPVSGPRITVAKLESATSILLTIQHDQGTDIRPGTPSDRGWTVFEGWTGATSPGTLRTVASCARVDATHLRLTLSSPVAGAASGVRVWPAYGQRKTLGGGSAMDNYSQTPTGLAIAAQLGSAFAQDFPIVIPTNGVVCS